jgi:hypothetical protein
MIAGKRGSQRSMRAGRVPNAVHESGPWRIREIAADFTLEDVWALPVHGGVDDFEAVIDQALDSDPAGAEESIPARALWRLRDGMGRWLGLGRVAEAITPGSRNSTGPLPIPGTHETSLRDRLPEDLRNTAAGLRFRRLPFVPLYRTDVEFAAEVSNLTVHGVMHLAWAECGGGRYQGQMAVYVKPRGLFGEVYMAAIKPFRYWVVYPALLREIERSWKVGRRPASRAATRAAR